MTREEAWGDFKEIVAGVSDVAALRQRLCEAAVEFAHAAAMGAIEGLAANLKRNLNTGFAQCDCCGRMVPQEQMSTGIAYGIETNACEECRGEQ